MLDALKRTIGGTDKASSPPVQSAGSPVSPEKAPTKTVDQAERGWLKPSLPAQHKTAQRVAFRLLWVLLLLGATVFIIVLFAVR